MSAQIDQSSAPTLKYLTMINADVDVPVYSDVPVGKSLIQTHADVSALNQSLHALMIRNLMILHANVSARIDQSAAPTLKYLTMTNADVNAPVYSDVLVGNGSIHVHVNVSVLSQGQSALTIRTLMM